MNSGARRILYAVLYVLSTLVIVGTMSSLLVRFYYIERKIDQFTSFLQLRTTNGTNQITIDLGTAS